MTPESRKLVRIAVISTGALLLTFGAGAILRPSIAKPSAAAILPVDPDALPGEAETFHGTTNTQALKDVSQEKGGPRTLAKYDALRAYPGAPPTIPHPILDERTMGGKVCLGCHTSGGYVPPFKAYAPVTPHPAWDNCRQCHVPQKEGATHFAAGSQWQKINGPAVGNNAALSGAPPPIPHALELRGNCVACHAGPGAVAEIRTPHPERQNCRQCHVPTTGSGTFDRGGAQ